MAYSKNTWENGDVITAAKLNGLEDAVAAIDTEINQARGLGGGESNTLGARIDDLVQVSATQPTSQNNEIWVDSSINGVVVPTYEEFSAAQAEVDELKSAMGVNNVLATFHDGYFLTTVGSVVDINTPSQASGWSYALLPCAEGDIISVSAGAYSNPCQYAFLDNNYTCIYRSGEVTQKENNIVQAVKYSAYILVNNNSGALANEKRKLYNLLAHKSDFFAASESIPKLNAGLSTLHDEINYLPDGEIYELTKGQYYAINNNKIDISAPSIGSGWGSVVIPCTYGDVFVFTGQGVANPPAYAFIRSDGSVKIKDATQTYLNRTQLVAPTEAVYAVFNNNYGFVEKPFVFKYRYKTTVPNLDAKIIRTTYANDLNYNALFDEYRTTGESNGILITTTETGFHIAGTAVSTFAYDLVREYDGFLSIFTPSEKYRIEADLPNNVALQVVYTPTAGSSETVLLSVWGSTDTVVTMPVSTPYTLRVSLVFINGTTYNNDIQVGIHRAGYDGLYKTSWYNGSLLETVHIAKKQYGSLVLLDSGTYDIVAELIAEYGETFFTNYNKSAADGWGIELTNGIVLRGMSDTVVTCNPGTYQTSTNNIRDYFSPFMYVGDCTVENIKIVAKNCKYCIHDDWLDKNVKARHVTENCVLIKDDTYNRCYGGGFTKSSEIIIRSCYFQDNTQAPVSIHNAVSSDAKSKAIIEGCYFENGTIRLGHYGASTEMSTVYIHGNSYKAAPYVVFEDQSSYANENMEYIAWCNEIRP